MSVIKDHFKALINSREKSHEKIAGSMNEKLRFTIRDKNRVRKSRETMNEKRGKSPRFVANREISPNRAFFVANRAKYERRLRCALVSLLFDDFVNNIIIHRIFSNSSPEGIIFQNSQKFGSL